MKPRLVIAFFALLFTVLGFFYHRTLQQDVATYEASLEQESSNLESPVVVEQEAFRWTEEEKSQLDALKSRFTVTPDGDTTWYYHKHWEEPLPLGTGLAAHVNADGDIFLVSYYQGNKLLNHQRVFVKIGDAIYDSTQQFVPEQPVEQLSQSQEVQEWGTYGGEQDERLLEAIAFEQEEDVLVRLAGEAGYQDFVLSASDKKAIKECVALHNLLKS